MLGLRQLLSNFWKTMNETGLGLKGRKRSPSPLALNEALKIKKVKHDEVEDENITDGTLTNCQADNAKPITNSPQNEKTKRKMVAILMAYCGQGYLGMQKNPGVKTIEQDFLTALLKADIIYQDHCEVPQNMRFQRSCRTDKGVSASRQIVSLRAALIDDLVDKTNSFLPPQIRVFGYKRVTRNFNCKTSCDARTYSYTMPTFAFTPVEEVTTEDYRISQETISQVNDVLSRFQGTHLFHNFTAGRTANDASCQRYIISFKCGQPSVKDGLEFVTVTIKGQSFMLHQIRKMIGLSIAIVRGITSVDTITKAWCPHRLDIPIAPGLGLVLEEVHYDKYNDRYGNDGLHEALKWDEHKDQLDKFKDEFILPTIINTEKKEKSMLKWLETLILHTFDVRHPSGPNDSPSGESLLGITYRQLKEKSKNANNEETNAHLPSSEKGESDSQTTREKAENSEKSAAIVENSDLNTMYGNSIS